MPLDLKFDFVAGAAVLFDKELSSEKRARAKAFADDVFARLREMYEDDFGGNFNVVRSDSDYTPSCLPSVAVDTFAALEPPAGEGKRRCILFIFHGELGEVAEDTAAAIVSYMNDHGRALGRTRIFFISESEELVKKINEAYYLGVWGIPESEIGDATADEVARYIYHGLA